MDSNTIGYDCKTAIGPNLKNDLTSLLFQLWPLPGDDDAEQLVNEAGLGDGEVDHRDLGRRFRREMRVLQTGRHLQETFFSIVYKNIDFR